LQRGRPLILQDVQADATQAVDVGVVDLGQEADLEKKGRRNERGLRDDERDDRCFGWMDGYDERGG